MAEVDDIQGAVRRALEAAEAKAVMVRQMKKGKIPAAALCRLRRYAQGPDEEGQAYARELLKAAGLE